MNLKSNIEGEIKKAMLAKEKDRLRALRAIKSMILLAETEKGGGEGLTEEVEVKILTKAAKQRRDSLEVYRNQSREDLASVEQAELLVIEEFLPKQMSEEELMKEVKILIDEIGASGMADMGKVMGAATGKFAGKADGKTISGIVRSLLS